MSCQSYSSNHPFFKNILVSQDFYFLGSLYAIKELLCNTIFYWTIHSGNFPLTSGVSFRLNLDKKTRLIDTFYKVYYCKLWRPTLLHEKNLFKPIYSRKYQVRKETNVEPFSSHGWPRDNFSLQHQYNSFKSVHALFLFAFIF